MYIVIMGYLVTYQSTKVFSGNEDSYFFFKTVNDYSEDFNQVMNFSSSNIMHQVIITPKDFKGDKFKEEIAGDAWNQNPANLSTYISI